MRELEYFCNLSEPRRENLTLSCNAHNFPVIVGMVDGSWEVQGINPPHHLLHLPCPYPTLHWRGNVSLTPDNHNFHGNQNFYPGRAWYAKSWVCSCASPPCPDASSSTRRSARCPTTWPTAPSGSCSPPPPPLSLPPLLGISMERRPVHKIAFFFRWQKGAWNHGPKKVMVAKEVLQIHWDQLQCKFVVQPGLQLVPAPASSTTWPSTVTSRMQSVNQGYFTPCRRVLHQIDTHMQIR